MSERATEGGPEHLSVRAATEAIARLEGFDEALVQRTTGLTWMLWGIVSAGIFVTYGMMSVAAGADLGWGYAVLWVPWVVAGAAFTSALWRTSAISAPRVLDGWDRRRQLLGGLVWMGVMLAVAGLLYLVEPALNEPVIFLFAYGAVWSFLGLVNTYRVERVARRVEITIGAVMIAASLAMAFFAGDRTDLSYALSGTFAPFIAGATPFLAGAWYMWRR